MKKTYIYRFSILFINFFFTLQSIYNPVFAAEVQTQKTNSFTLSNDIKEGKLGSVYYATNKKDEVLLKSSIWGAIQFPGVHYLPLGTRFLDALSIAGGPMDLADKDNIILSTHTKNGLEVKNLSVFKAMSDQAYNPYIQADDILMVKEDKYYQNWGLGISIGTFIMSTIILGFLVEDRNKK